MPSAFSFEQDLPVGGVEPGRPVGLAQRDLTVNLKLLHGQLLERHGQQVLAALEGLPVEEESLLLHGALHVVRDGVAGTHLPELGQELVSQRRPGGRRRL